MHVWGHYSDDWRLPSSLCPLLFGFGDGVKGEGREDSKGKRRRRRRRDGGGLQRQKGNCPAMNSE